MLVLNKYLEERLCCQKCRQVVSCLVRRRQEDIKYIENSSRMVHFMVTLPYLPPSLTASIPVAQFLCVCECVCVSRWQSTTVTLKEILPCSYGYRQLPIIACLCHMVALPLVLACRSSSFQMGLFHFKILQIHLAEEILTTHCDRS